MNSIIAMLETSGSDFFRKLFDWREFMPRRFCMLNQPEVVWLHVISDAVIMLAYYLIPFGLIYFMVKRKDLAFKPLFFMFGLFILACGTTHLMGILAIWTPYYRLDGVVKAITALLSVATAIALLPLIPKALALPSPAQLTQANRELDTAYRQVKETERLKSEFFANVSHELRTPLTLTLAPVESLLAGDYGAINEPQRQALQTMHNNSVRLVQMVNGLLDFSKLDANKLEVRRDPTEIVALTRAIVADFQPLLQQKKLVFDFQARSPLAHVQIDRYLYERIVFNLLSNAVKFTPEGGRIDVALEASQDKLRLDVRDTGIGIAAEDLPKLFQKFRQLESTATRRFEGTGLGLAMVKEFAGLLGGDVRVESVPGGGSTFTVECLAPASAASAEAAAPAAIHVQKFAAPATEVSSSAGESLSRVLIAEDNPELAAYIRDVLAGTCDTRIARDGEEAGQILSEWKPDLVLTDVMMPKRDGFELCRQIKSDPATFTIPVVLITALTNRDAVLKGWEAGADEYVYKPFHPKELVTRIRTLLNAVHQRRQAQEALAQRADELATINKELESFSYSVSHDLRAPLRRLDGFSEALLEEYGEKLDEDGKDMLQRIRAGSQRMGQLIDDLLNLSRLSRSELRHERVNLSAVAGSVAAELRKRDPDRQVELRIADNLKADGDPQLLRIALENLLDNAWKYTSKQPHATIEFGLSRDNEESSFFVRDDGVGFDMQHADKLFAPFQRLHTANDFAGTGIGLATVQRIVRRHGGRIWTEAKVNKGATFHFTLS